MKKPEDDIVELAKVPTAQEAHLLALALEDAGIKTRVVGDFLDAGVGSLNAVPAEVWVGRADLPQAQSIKADLDAARRLRQIQEPEDEDE